MGTPAAEIELDASAVGRLVSAQHPALAGELRFVAHGWDNDIWRLGDDHSVRMPRRAASAPLIEHEQRWLPRFAERMPVAVPAPVAVGEPGDGFPWRWSIVPWFTGTPMDGIPVAARATAARDLADAFAALHIPAPADAPVNVYRGVPLADRDPLARERLREVELPEAERAALTAVWDDTVAAPPWPSVPLWLHGDPHPANMILDEHGALEALIDFGDLCQGDPANDLAAAWLCFDAEARTAFRSRLEATGAYDAHIWRRARGWAVLVGTALLIASTGTDRMLAIGRHTLQQVLAD
ncbi:aminoglycoside phosphotransferase (APT) family kinase protein [Diaminobutyricimonas aerilata]|uniref:Aminoglycoside phosphotransferase (APT) family kinase protein n=1 Tax=Diaminobutyricimonas aerilata TaxID=1162967 RepID=A0A2M9CN91_9MICO|nr:aminoglycoside phosphotransferase family protein [Diaminobutyricimonas aerilata]PJJ73375.1 aminoglycoside phosphotransferase (APT) family kinase protein [Diaminobutyricimonas aerilata]